MSSYIAKVDFVIHEKAWNYYFSTYPLVLDSYIMPNTNRKMGLSVILKVQPI